MSQVAAVSTSNSDQAVSEKAKNATHQGREYKVVDEKSSKSTDRFGNSLIVAGALFTAFMAAIAVGIAEASLASAAIALGIGLGITVLLSLFFKTVCPDF